MRSVLIGLVLVTGIIVAGCNQKPRPTTEAPQYFSHTVQYQGETLGAIAKWYTGSTSNWQAIQQANPDLRPNRIRQGMTILIPTQMVIRQDAFPRPSKVVTAKTAPTTEQPNLEQANTDDSWAAETTTTETTTETASVATTDGTEVTETTTVTETMPENNSDANVWNTETTTSPDGTTTVTTTTVTNGEGWSNDAAALGMDPTTQEPPTTDTQVTQDGGNGNTIDGVLGVLGKAVIASKEEQKNGVPQ